MAMTLLRALIIMCIASSTTALVATLQAPRLVANRRSAATITMAASGDDSAKLLEAAARLRAEIAEMEGKTVEQVEAEAAEEKLEAETRAAALAAERAEQNARREVEAAKRSAPQLVLSVPSSLDQMTTQAARAVERAHVDGICLQTVRLALVKEDEGLEEDSQWPGGAEQMYREAGRPLTEELLRKVRPLTKERDGVDLGALPPSITVQDIWDFDGSALMTAEAHAGPEGDVQVN